MSDLSSNYEHVMSRIQAATEHAKRVNAPALMAVSKRHGVESIKALAAFGQVDFGESYAQEGVKKIQLLKELPLVWHFIGPIQSNKVKLIAANFDWVHSIDRMKTLKLLSHHRANVQAPLNVLLQLKIGDEPSKSGATFEGVIELAAHADKFEGVILRGLMCIPPASNDINMQCDYFQEAVDVFNEMASKYPQVDTLSMGMSGDLEAAIQTGSTMVRVGTDIFGKRPE